MKKLVINGMVLTQEKLVGVPRYVNELLRSLDAAGPDFEVEVLVPRKVEQRYRCLKKVILPQGRRPGGKPGDILWQAMVLPRYVCRTDGVLLHPAMGYSFFGNDILVVYDLQPEHFRANYMLGSGLYEKAKLRLRAHAIRSCRLILTISEYVKQDLMTTYSVPEHRIRVVPCGWDHFARVCEDDTIFSAYPALAQKKGQYYFSLGSRYAHKNQQWIYAAAQQNPNALFVITGYNDVASYSGQLVKEAPENVLFTGFLPDGQVKALMRHCRAFLHPSLSEGFGLPPMEALSVGAQVIVSNTTSLPEIYGETVHYIDPRNYTEIDLDRILGTEVKPPEDLLEQYTWAHAAERFREAVTLVL